MELKEYLLMEFDGLERGLNRVLDGLTPTEVAWRPGHGCNSIGLILYHMVKSEDMFIQSSLRQTAQVWETGSWWTKLKVDKDEAGAHYTPEQVDAFPPVDAAKVMKYAAAVRKQTVKYVKGLKAGDFDRMVKLGGPFPEMPMAALFSLIISHAAQHIGEMSYLRGLQRGQEGPPPPAT